MSSPQAKYIARYAEAYTNHNLTTWEQMSDDPKPRNNLTVRPSLILIKI